MVCERRTSHAAELAMMKAHLIQMERIQMCIGMVLAVVLLISCIGRKNNRSRKDNCDSASDSTEKSGSMKPHVLRTMMRVGSAAISVSIILLAALLHQEPVLVSTLMQLIKRR